MAIHDVNMDEVGPGRFDAAGGFGDSSKIGREDGRGDKDHFSGSLPG
jgi:hypothetical protein